jgi:hypothetical protein
MQNNAHDAVRELAMQSVNTAIGNLARLTNDNTFKTNFVRSILLGIVRLQQMYPGVTSIDVMKTIGKFIRNSNTELHENLINVFNSVITQHPNQPNVENFNLKNWVERQSLGAHTLVPILYYPVYYYPLIQ